MIDMYKPINPSERVQNWIEHSNSTPESSEGVKGEGEWWWWWEKHEIRVAGWSRIIFRFIQGATIPLKDFFGNPFSTAGKGTYIHSLPKNRQESVQKSLEICIKQDQKCEANNMQYNEKLSACTPYVPIYKLCSYWSTTSLISIQLFFYLQFINDIYLSINFH